MAELTITISPEPLNARSAADNWARIAHHVVDNHTPIVSVVIHSWSFMPRDAAGFHEWQGPQYVDILRQFIETAPAGTRFVSAAQIGDMLQNGEIELDILKNIDDLILNNPH